MQLCCFCLVPPVVRCPVRLARGARYAMPGTDTASICPMLSAYAAATRCPVLTQRMVLPGSARRGTAGLRPLLAHVLPFMEASSSGNGALLRKRGWKWHAFVRFQRRWRCFWRSFAEVSSIFGLSWGGSDTVCVLSLIHI
eukprot:1727495-Rhodomonas_salina.2